MNISNFIELINAKVLNYGATSSVYDFSIDLNKIKQASVFFAKNQEQANYAVKLGSYVIVAQEKLEIKDKEVFYLEVENLEQALLRLFRFLIQEKNIKFLFCSKIELEFAKAFGLKVLNSDIFLDFNNLKNSKNDSFFCAMNEEYLLKLTPNIHTLKSNSYEIIGKKSLFYTSLICKNLYFKDLKFAFFYAKIFSSFVAFVEENKIHFTFDDKKLNLFHAFFLDYKNEICDFGSSSRVVLLVEDEESYDFIAYNLKNFDCFKTAKKNSLFCDISYKNLNDFKMIYDYKYCLINENLDEFLNIFSPNKKEYSLFD
ncbi:hypothetical protein O8I50_03445 [Campylobacter lari]|uniref:hypothetical protein n=1 Tax=Campylobacter lari TaxID=201 RepID=UPI00372681A4